MFEELFSVVLKHACYILFYSFRSVLENNHPHDERNITIGAGSLCSKSELSYISGNRFLFELFFMQTVDVTRSVIGQF